MQRLHSNNQVRNPINLSPSKQVLSTERIFHNTFFKEFSQIPLTHIFKIYNEWTRRKIICNLPFHVLPLFSVPSVRPVRTIVWLHTILCLSSEGCPVKLTILLNVVSVKNILRLEKYYLFLELCRSVIWALLLPLMFEGDPLPSTPAVNAGIWVLRHSRLVCSLSLSF